MARLETVADCHVKNIAWHDDPLCFNFPKSKCNQKEKHSVVIQHVHATPATFFPILMSCVPRKIIFKLTYLIIGTQSCLRAHYSTVVLIKSSRKLKQRVKKR